MCKSFVNPYYQDEYGDVAVEVAPIDCLWCNYGEIPEDAEPPFPLCLKCLDIALFILQKADLHPKVIYK